MMTDNMENNICDKCNYPLERIDKATGEKYVNRFGTRCPKCNHLIKTDFVLNIQKENEKKIIELRKKMLSKIKKKEANNVDQRISDKN